MFVLLNLLLVCDWFNDFYGKYCNISVNKWVYDLFMKYF